MARKDQRLGLCVMCRKVPGVVHSLRHNGMCCWPCLEADNKAHRQEPMSSIRSTRKAGAR